MGKPTCIKCDKPADKVYKPDLDLTGIGMCSEHEQEVTLDIMVATLDKKGWKMFEKKYLKNDNKSN